MWKYIIFKDWSFPSLVQIVNLLTKRDKMLCEQAERALELFLTGVAKLGGGAQGGHGPLLIGE